VIGGNMRCRWMVDNILSSVISKRYRRVPIYHELLQQDGVHLPSAKATSQIGRTAGQLMHRDVRFLSSDLSIEDAWVRRRQTMPPLPWLALPTSSRAR